MEGISLPFSTYKDTTTRRVPLGGNCSVTHCHLMSAGGSRATALTQCHVRVEHAHTVVASLHQVCVPRESALSRNAPLHPARPLKYRLSHCPSEVLLRDTHLSMSIKASFSRKTQYQHLPKKQAEATGTVLVIPSHIKTHPFRVLDPQLLLPFPSSQLRKRADVWGQGGQSSLMAAPNAGGGFSC